MKIFLILSLIFSISAFAQTKKIPAKPVAKPVIEPMAEESKMSFGANLYNRVATQVVKPDAGPRSQYLLHEFIPYFKTGDFKVEATFDYYNFYDNTAASEWDNTQFLVNLNTGWGLSDYFNLMPQLIAKAPLFKKSSSDFQGSGGVRLMLGLNSKAIDMPNLILKYGWQIQKFSQKHEIIMDSNKNFVLDANGDKQYTTDLQLRQRLLLGYMLTEKLMAMIYFHFDSNVLFDGNVRNGFYHETFLEYTINENFYLNSGLTNGGGLFAGDFQEKDNLKFFSKESSQYFAGLGFNF